MLAFMRPCSTESKFRLLYLGTDVELTRALRKALARPDYRLVACSDHDSAVLFLESEIPYDLLLIDFEWRQREGLKLAQMAHELKHRKRMPIILVTAKEANSDLKALARRSGVNKCVTKTPDAVAVGKAIKELVNSKQ